MQRKWLLAAALSAVATIACADNTKKGDDKDRAKVEPAVAQYFKNDDTTTDSSVTVEGSSVGYHAIAGTLIVHPKDWDDVTQSTEGEAPPPGEPSAEKAPAPQKDTGARASMFYAYYAKSGTRPEERPLMFLFNGGPGSSTVWLHMGAFGPRRVITADDKHTPAAPYKLVNNDYSLLDASDLVFIDAPGAGFSRITGKDKEKAFWGVDADAWAFAEFITQFLSKYGRWNSPKYLFGESYGTTRAAVLANMLETERSIDLNGIVMLSQILNFDMSADSPQFNPGVDLPYMLALPTYAASAWYHNKLPGKRPPDMQKFLGEVQHFAMGDYSQALQANAALNNKQRQAIANRLHQYTGLPVWYILKANLRIDGGMFEQNLQGNADITTGRLDTRFSGPTMDPLNKEADYDPQSASISSAYVSALNDYVRKQLNYGHGKQYKPFADVFRSWDFQHKVAGVPIPLPQATNVIPDLSTAMKYNPNLHVMLTGGYFDLATPYYEGIYEMRHMQIPRALQRNIEYRYYPSGHMVYAHEDSLKAIHDHTADFIRRTSNIGGNGGWFSH
ncbi:MAG: peptidase S10 [Alphaproteobacteria bacterium]|nr:peptidase S10 [Alphaproteobacteria bacterium]